MSRRHNPHSSHLGIGSPPGQVVVVVATLCNSPRAGDRSTSHCGHAAAPAGVVTLAPSAPPHCAAWTISSSASSAIAAGGRCQPFMQPGGPSMRNLQGCSKQVGQGHSVTGAYPDMCRPMTRKTFG